MKQLGRAGAAGAGLLVRLAVGRASGGFVPAGRSENLPNRRSAS